jgi:hypothetical protein
MTGAFTGHQLEKETPRRSREIFVSLGLFSYKSSLEKFPGELTEFASEMLNIGAERPAIMCTA